MKFKTTKLAGLGLIVIGLLTACSPTTGSTNSKLISNSGSIISTNGTSHDWGDINIKGGKVDHTFTFQNNSPENLQLIDSRTSCMCTAARYKLADESISPKYGMQSRSNNWSAEIEPGGTFEVEVFFDPMAHGPNGTGLIRRNVFLNTSSKEGIVDLEIVANVLSKNDYSEKYPN